MNRHNPADRAGALLEVLIVLAMLALTAVLSLPVAAKISPSRSARHDARILAQLIASEIALAELQNAPTLIRFQGDRYTIERGRQEREIRLNPGNSVRVSSAAPDRVTIYGSTTVSPATIEIAPRAGGAPCRITLSLRGRIKCSCL